jgi:hypothetical protein
LRSGKLVEILPGWTGENPLLVTLWLPKGQEGGLEVHGIGHTG